MSFSETVNGPFQGKLSVTFVPQCDFNGSEREVVVSTRYIDSDAAYDVNAVQIFDRDGPVPWVWEVPVLDRSKTTFEYKVDIIYDQDTSEHGDWEKASSEEGTILVGPVSKVYAPLKIPVFLARDYWKNNEWTLIVAHLHYKDETNGIFINDALIFNEERGLNLEWYLPIKEPRAITGQLSYKIYAYAHDSTNNVVLGPFEAEGPFVVVEL